MPRCRAPTPDKTHKEPQDERCSPRRGAAGARPEPRHSLPPGALFTDLDRAHRGHPDRGLAGLRQLPQPRPPGDPGDGQCRGDRGRQHADQDPQRPGRARRAGPALGGSLHRSDHRPHEPRHRAHAGGGQPLLGGQAAGGPGGHQRPGHGALRGLHPAGAGQQRRDQPGVPGQRKPPVAPAGAAGLRINLVSQLGNSLRVGDPVTYQGYTVGRVEDAIFEAQTRRMQHRVFIEAPYDTLVTDSTRFWSASGIDLRLDSEGFRVNVESFEALLGGGVTFGVPEDLPLGSRVEPDVTFNLYPDEDSARQGTFNRYLEYVLLVDDSVRGLSRGAPVEFRGVRVGTVAAVPWNFNAPQPDGRSGFSIPVLIRIEPQRLGIENRDVDLDEWRQRFDRLFGFGLRASLKSGNLLTGALFVDLNFNSDLAGTHAVETFAETPVFPTVAGGFALIEAQVTDLLAKLNDLEIEPLLAGLDRNLAASEAMLGEVRELSASLQGLLDDPSTREVPANLNATLAELRDTLQGVSPGSPAYQELTGAVERLERLMRDIQPVARTLSDNPRALLFDSLQTEDPVPRAPRRD